MGNHMKDLFQVEPAQGYKSLSGKEPDLAMGYAHKFWDAGNQVVVLIYGAAFGVYLALRDGSVFLEGAKEHRNYIIVLAIISNAALMFLIFRLYVHEHRVSKAITNNEILLDGIKSAFHMRLALVLINLLIYILFFLALGR